MKQIYDKHKYIWWELANVGEQMTRNEFLWLQYIAYLDQNHKRDIWRLHKNLALSIQSWVCAHLDDIFYFQDANEVNGI
jgi:hypothetical protein